MRHNYSCRQFDFYMCRIVSMNTTLFEPVTTEVARAIELSGGPAVVARALQVSTQTVCFYRDGERRLKTDHGAMLESICGGRVTRKDIWPKSWQRIWPELVTTPAANDPQASQPAEQGVGHA